jgi:hypothetical protein
MFGEVEPKKGGSVKAGAFRRLATAAGFREKGRRRKRPRPDSRLLRRWPSGTAMPSLVRFLVFCLVMAALAGAAMFYLATFVEPSPSETTIRLPAERLQPN